MSGGVNTYEQYIPSTRPQVSSGGAGGSYFSSGADTLNQARGAAMPSPQSLDTASARVRSRISGQTQANEQAIRNRFAGRGAISGQLNRNLMQNQFAGQQAYAQGLTDLELGFMDKQQEGARILTDVGSTYGTLGNDYGTVTNNAQDVENRFALGRGELGARFADTARQSQDDFRTALTEMLKYYGQFGNTVFSRGNEYVRDERDFLTSQGGRLFGDDELAKYFQG